MTDNRNVYRVGICSGRKATARDRGNGMQVFHAKSTHQDNRTYVFKNCIR